jgi:predicted MPP superfamily phosphohydrolase
MIKQFYSFGTTTLFIILLDYYIYRNVIKLNFPYGKRYVFNILWWSVTSLGISLIFISIFFKIPFWLESLLNFIPLTLLVTKIICLPIFVLNDLLFYLKRALRRVGGEKRKSQSEITNEEISRSQFLLKSGILVSSIPLFSLTGGFISGAYDYQVRIQKLILPNLPKAFNGIKIGQISDIHTGSFYNKTAVLGGIEMLLAQKPDLIFFTGDLVNDFASEATDYLSIFSKIKAPLGVYSILGNHDYGDYHFNRKYFFETNNLTKEKNFENIKAIHKTLGWNLLLNDSHELILKGEHIYINGVEIWGINNPYKYGNMEVAMGKIKDKSAVQLLLSHDPSHWRGEILPKYPEIDIMFSGHTHGGQFGVRNQNYQWSPIQYMYKEWAGLYTQENQKLYVNVGFGFLGYPGRVGILPEITIFELSTG